MPDFWSFLHRVFVLRVLYLHQYFVAPRMAGGSRSYEMARALAEAGHDVHVLTAWREADTPARSDWFQEELDGFVVHWLPVPYSNTMGPVRRMYAFIVFAYKASKRAIALGGDLIFGTSTPLTIAIPAVRAARKLRVPMVFEVRDLWPELPVAMGILTNPLLIALANRLERHAYDNSAHVIALSPGMASGVTRTGFPAEKITIIPNTSNIELFGPCDDAEEKFLQDFPGFRGRKLIVYTGALGKANGVDYLVRMAAEMLKLDPEIYFLIAGTGKFRSSLERLAHDTGVLGRTLWIIDPIAKEDMPGLLHAATMSCSLLIDMPEMANSSPNKFFDAIASGTPVVINWRGWLADVVDQTKAGLVVPPNEPEQAANMLFDYLADQERVDDAGSQARALAIESFDRRKLANKFVGVLEGASEAL